MEVHTHYPISIGGAISPERGRNRRDKPDLRAIAIRLSPIGGIYLNPLQQHTIRDDRRFVSRMIGESIRRLRVRFRESRVVA
jgi:hypothetical protein